MQPADGGYVTSTQAFCPNAGVLARLGQDVVTACPAVPLKEHDARALATPQQLLALKACGCASDMPHFQALPEGAMKAAPLGLYVVSGLLDC